MTIKTYCNKFSCVLSHFGHLLFLALFPPTYSGAQPVSSRMQKMDWCGAGYWNQDIYRII